MTNKIALTPELQEKAKAAPNAEALLAVVQESGVTLTAEEAASAYAQLHDEAGAMSDEAMDDASGGKLKHGSVW